MPERPSKFLPALYGGIIIGLISGIPILSLLNCLCCAGVMFGGLMSVFFYKKDLPPQLPLTSNDSLILGVLSGLIGAVVSTIVSAGLYAVVGDYAREAVQNALEGSGVLNQMPPESREQMAEALRSGGAVSFFHLVISLIIYPIFGLIGGLIGYSIFKPKGPMMNVPPATPTTPVPPTLPQA